MLYENSQQMKVMKSYQSLIKPQILMDKTSVYMLVNGGITCQKTANIRKM